MAPSHWCDFVESLFTAPPIYIGPVYVRVRGRDTRVLKAMRRGPTEDKQQQEKTRRGKHSWLPLSLLTPAVGCNLHSNRTWKHCAELIFEVVIFNNPPSLLFFNCSILWKLISQWCSLLTNNLWHAVKKMNLNNKQLLKWNNTETEWTSHLRIRWSCHCAQYCLLHMCMWSKKLP